MTAMRIELTMCERQVLDGLANGRTRSQIARELGLQRNTVDTTVRYLFDKLAAVTEAQAVHVAHQQGLFADLPTPADPARPGLRRVWDNPDVISRRRQILNDAMKTAKGARR